MQLLQEALSYLNKGKSVIPIKPDKLPYIKWQEYQQRLPTAEEINRWWNLYPNANIAIITGKISNITVVDIDAGKPPAWLGADTTIAKTGGGGWHYYYKYKEGVRNKARITTGIEGLEMDIRGDGGYIIAPPSITEKGEYKFINICELAELPQELIQKIQISKENKPYNGIVYDYSNDGTRHDNLIRYIGNLFRNYEPEQWDAVIPNIAIAVDANNNNPAIGYKEVMAMYMNIREKEFARIDKNKKIIVPKKELYKIITAKELLAINPKPFPYIIDKLIPEQAITSITADSGQGKSLLSLIFAEAIAKGETLFGEYMVKKSKVLIIDQEMDEDIIVSRYKALVDSECDIDYLYEQFWMISEEKDYLWLEDMIKINQYKVIILDTLTNIHDKEENSSKDMREVNKLLLKLIADNKITVIYLHHHRKRMSGEKMGQSSSRGSTEIIAKVASHLLIESDKKINNDNNMELDITIEQEKSRRPESIDKIALKIVYDVANKKTTYQYMGIAYDSKVEEAKSFILEELQNNEMITKDGFLETYQYKHKKQLSSKHLFKALKELLSKNTIIERTKKDIVEKRDDKTIPSALKFYDNITTT